MPQYESELYRMASGLLQIANDKHAAITELIAKDLALAPEALAIAQVVLEHDRMLIGLPGSAYHRTAERRRRQRSHQHHPRVAGDGRDARR